jgi:hypothetical protein
MHYVFQWRMNREKTGTVIIKNKTKVEVIQQQQQKQS